MLRLTNISLRPLTTFRVPASAATYIRLESQEDIDLLANSIAHLSAETLFFGGGSNFLFVQDFAGTLLHMLVKGIEVKDEGHSVVVTAWAGEIWDEFVAYCTEHGYYGLENLSLIPGYVGAAPVQNIGAYGCELSQHFEFAEALDIQSGILSRFTREACGFGYRHSIFKVPVNKHLLITRVGFRLHKDKQVITGYQSLNEELHQKGIEKPLPADIREAVIAIRRRKLPDPEILGNAGSFFKNPVVSLAFYNKLKERYPDIVSFPSSDNTVKLAAGWLIDNRGWKGFRQGDAGVHNMQALVLVNYGKATGMEVFDLARKIRDDIHAAYGIVLEPEVNIVGESWS